MKQLKQPSKLIKLLDSFFNLFSIKKDSAWILLGPAFPDGFFVLIVSFTTVFIESSELSFVKRSDFKPYFTAAHLIKTGRMHDLYNSKIQHDTQHKVIARHNFLFFLNLPTSALIFIPFTFLEVETAYKAYSVFSLIVSYYAIALLFWFTKTDFKKLLYLVFFVPLASSITANQISIIVFLIYVFIYISFLRRKNFWGGFFSGLLIFKMQHLLFLPFGLILSKDRVAYLKGAALSLGTYILANFVIYGPNLFTDYLNFMSSRTPDIKCLEHLGSHNLFSFQAIGIYRCTQLETGILAVISVLFYIGFLYLVYKKRNVQPIDLLFSTSIIATLFLNYHTRYTDMVLLTIPLLVVLNMVYKAKRKVVPTALLVLFYLLPLFTIEHGQWVSVIGFLGVGIFMSLDRKTGKSLESKY